MVNEYVSRAKEAQAQLSKLNQNQIDEIVRAIAKMVFDNAEELAAMAVEETGMGVLENKIAKNKGKSTIIWNALKGKPSIGILRTNEAEGITEVAKPLGVIAAVTPCTNPIVTPMCNAMFAIKCGNAIIIAPHPRAKKCAMHLNRIFREAIAKLGAPADIYQTLPEPDVELTGELMKACDTVIATGGMGMVKAAYSSGKPSFGVGAGNVQCIFDTDINLEEEVPKAIAGRVFDNGIICSAEQTIIAQKNTYQDVIDCFIKNGAYYVDDPAVVKTIGEKLFPNGEIAKDAIGQSVQRIAELAGISIPAGTKIIIVKPETYGEGSVWSKEKMFPVMSAYACDSWENAVEIAKANLMVEGAGHSVAIHSNNQEHIEYAGLELPVSRILVNQICATQNGGSFTNGLNPTTTLGCGSWGNNSISENLFYTHLMNVSRVATVKPNWLQPTPEEIWS